MKNLQNEKIRYYYNENQSFYDFFWMNKKNLAMHYGYWEKGTKNRSQALLNENYYVENMLDLNNTDIVLDAGCGVGGTSIDIAEKYKSKVVGISLVGVQVDAANKNAKERNVADLVSFKLEDYNNTSFPDGSFTKIFAIESACHSENKSDFIKEAYRLLRPGGKLVVCDYFVNKIQNRTDKRNYETLCGGWAMANLSEKDKYNDYLKNNKFENIRFDDYTKLAMKSARFMNRLAWAWLPIDQTLNFVNIVSDQNLISTKASISQYYLFKDGALLHGIFSADKPMGKKPLKKQE